MGRDLNEVALCKKNYWRIITSVLPFPCERAVIFKSNSRVRSFTTLQATASPSPPFLAPPVVQTPQHHPACALRASSPGKWSFLQAWWVTSTWFYSVALCERESQTKNQTNRPHRAQKCAFFSSPPLHPAQLRCSALSPDVPKPSFLPSFMNQYNDHLLTLLS